MPESTITVTTTDSFPSRSATRSAAATLAPVEVPANIPSSFASRRAIFMASAVDTVIISFTNAGRHSGGIKPIPIPSILCEPEGLPERTALSSGSTAIMLISGFCLRKAFVVP